MVDQHEDMPRLAGPGAAESTNAPLQAGPSSRYRLPLSLLSPSPRDTPKLRAGEVERMAKLAVSRRNLEAIALTRGLTITRETQADSGLTLILSQATPLRQILHIEHGCDWHD